MSMERLSHQIDAYVAWKRELMREITRYRGWLERSRLNSPAVEAKLERALRQLRADHITLAFVGEFSRGKTELINSLFFAGYGQRMLPSHAGRTTMCPTELFHDPRAEHSYIRLLPIETRLADASVAQFKRVPRHWVNIPLDTGDPEGMAQAFAQVAKTKALPVEQAIQLGFHPDALEAADEPDQVRVPAWRHALVNFDHPLLRQGLRILDTPGLNALGSEPELTLSMLPNAQAILFLLSADAGVTASDMEIWQKYIQPLREDGHSSLFAVLNKIDVLWDDLSGERFVQNAIRLIQDGTARQLGLQRGDVLPLSAKQALLAKVRGEPALLERSRLDRLEALLCERIVAQKERLLEDAVVGQVLALVNNSQHSLRVRLDKVKEQQAQLNDQQQAWITSSTPRSQVSLQADWSYRRWGLTLRETRYSKTVSELDYYTGEHAYSTTVFNRFENSPKYITDVALRYAASRNLTLSAGANNLFDVKPDKLPAESAYLGFNQYDTYASQISFNGAFYYLGAAYTF